MDRKSFDWWLVGFIDGEGSFGVYPSGAPSPTNNNKKRMRVEFVLKLRADDIDVLTRARDHLDVGRVYKAYHNNPNMNNQAVWQVTKISDLVKLKAFLDKHNMQSKKMHEYIYWRRAVSEMQKSVKSRKEDVLRQLKRNITEVRTVGLVSED